MTDRVYVGDVVNVDRKPWYVVRVDDGGGADYDAVFVVSLETSLHDQSKIDHVLRRR
jgi:hypothetical protein